MLVHQNECVAVEGFACKHSKENYVSAEKIDSMIVKIASGSKQNPWLGMHIKLFNENKNLNFPLYLKPHRICTQCDLPPRTFLQGLKIDNVSPFANGKCLYYCLYTQQYIRGFRKFCISKKFVGLNHMNINSKFSLKPFKIFFQELSQELQRTWPRTLKIPLKLFPSSLKLPSYVLLNFVLKFDSNIQKVQRFL
jgi:hypothetical protein